MEQTAPALGTAAALTESEAAGLFLPLEDAAHILVAVSGGPDSIALLGLLAEWAAQPGRPAVSVATVDHGLRAASAGEARDVAGLCERLGVPHAILAWTGDKPKAGVQARARAARYELLAAHARSLGGAALVTAHTLDDQAETVLMRLAHGSGPAGMAGMRVRSEVAGVALLRPLLTVAKARLIATARVRGLTFVDDPSNVDPRFERVRWRALLPVLAQAGLDASRLALFAQRCARLDGAVEARVEVLEAELLMRAERAASLPFARLVAEEPLEIVTRLVARLVQDGDTETGRLERLEACVAALIAALPGGRGLRRTLGGRVLTLDRSGRLSALPERPRRRGVHPASP